MPEPADTAPPPAAATEHSAANLAASGWKCPTCGGHLAWSPGRSALVCGSCSAAVAIQPPGEAPTHPFSVAAIPPSSPGRPVDRTCPQCGASATIPATELAGSCAYCTAPWVVTALHEPTPPPDGVVPAVIDIATAQADIATWVRSRWFAPNDFKSGASQPTVTIAYHPVWTFDAGTVSQYTGERGDDYYTTEYSQGPNGTQVETQVRHTRWSPARGMVHHDFADVAVPAAPDTNPKDTWDYASAHGYADAYLVGMRGFAATVPLAEAWASATQTMAAAIRTDIDRAIGGDHQRISSVSTEYSDTTGRYLLAPSWSGEYAYKGREYAIDVNAETGQVTGTRPYSAIKIALAVIVIVVILAAVIAVIMATTHPSTPSPMGASAVLGHGAALAATPDLGPVPQRCPTISETSVTRACCSWLGNSASNTAAS